MADKKPELPRTEGLIGKPLVEWITEAGVIIAGCVTASQLAEEFASPVLRWAIYVFLALASVAIYRLEWKHKSVILRSNNGDERFELDARPLVTRLAAFSTFLFVLMLLVDVVWFLRLPVIEYTDSEFSSKPVDAFLAPPDAAYLEQHHATAFAYFDSSHEKLRYPMNISGMLPRFTAHLRKRDDLDEVTLKDCVVTVTAFEPKQITGVQSPPISPTQDAYCLFILLDGKVGPYRPHTVTVTEKGEFRELKWGSERISLRDEYTKFFSLFLHPTVPGLYTIEAKLVFEDGRFSKTSELKWKKQVLAVITPESDAANSAMIVGVGKKEKGSQINAINFGRQTEILVPRKLCRMDKFMRVEESQEIEIYRVYPYVLPSAPAPAADQAPKAPDGAPAPVPPDEIRAKR